MPGPTGPGSGAAGRLGGASVLGLVEPRAFRHVLGHFCTGVTVITALADGTPAGFACQSFAALSLDPPLILFCPNRNSRTWPVIERAGHCCVNLLAHHQRDISTVFGRPGTAKFRDIAWHPSPAGAPILPDVLAWLDCAVEDVHSAGDHYIVTGRVTALGEPTTARPLLYFRGTYTETDDTRATPITWPREGDWL